MKKPLFLAALGFVFLVAAAGFYFRIWPPPGALPAPVTFDGQRAWRDVNYQVSLGPRIPDSQAHKQTVDWMVAELKQAGWKVEIQKTSRLGHPIENVVADWGSGNPWILLGAHYDSRMRADQDPSPALRSQPVPGANDGASGVAVLLELARLLPSHLKGAGGASRVTLVFFDAEDNGDLPGWDWILGSQAYAAQLSEKPDAAVVLDMIGDANLDIYMERNSDSTLNDQIWAAAQQDGYAQQFIPQYKFSMLDDHIPFRDAGIPSVDLIDFDYPYWHTTGDTPDKVSAQSLKAVGDTLVTWLAKPR